jgi:hypothetical protein
MYQLLNFENISYGNLGRRRVAVNTGANPTVASCNAGAVTTYNATSSLMRFGNK